MKEIVIVIMVILLGSLAMTFAPENEIKQWQNQDKQQKETMKRLFIESGLPEIVPQQKSIFEE